ncbi:hypothetical protein [Blastomonas aquatica]
MSPQPKKGNCAPGWSDVVKPGGPRTDTCYPGRNAKPTYYPGGRECADGYFRSAGWCLPGEKKTVTATAGSVQKANPLDRCPAGYFTLTANGNMCTSLAANPPTIRLKGDAACGEGEIDDWGLYCISNYGNLTRKDAAKGFPDYNAIYQTSYTTTGKQQRPRQEALPEGLEYTPAYFVIFGRVDRDGAPIPGGSVSGSATASSSDHGAAGQAPASTVDCSAAGASQAGASAGARLGGLMGGRSGKASRAGAALGGALGGVAQREVQPAGCP